MDTESSVLSKEEVDELLKVSKDPSTDPTHGMQDADNLAAANTNAIHNIHELKKIAWEEILSSFLRRKVLIKNKQPVLAKLAACVNPQEEKNIYIDFLISPHESHGMIILSLHLIHQLSNILFGAPSNANETIIESPGKMGPIIGQKIANLLVEGFAKACKEYGEIKAEVTKTTHLLNFLTNFNSDDMVYCSDITIFFDEIETNIKFLLPQSFILKFIPAKENTATHREKDFWRTAIKSKFVDSSVTINVTLHDIKMKMKEVLALKEGDLIEIEDPRSTYICLNQIKLYRAIAGQADDKLVVKVLNQI